MNLENKKILIFGGTGMVGQSLVSYARKNYSKAKILAPIRKELDLTYRELVFDYFKKNKPEVMIIAAAKVGGIQANDNNPVDFLLENLKIQNNLIEAAHCFNVKKVLFLGSSCIYPKLSPQPIKEEYLLTGELEPTNQWYAIAKIAGLKLIEAYRRQYDCSFISAMPTNLYGPNDNFDLETSHVMPALIKKIIKAKETNDSYVEIWGSGEVKREFLHVNDLSEACFYLIEKYDDAIPINIGSGSDVKIIDLAKLIADCVGFKGQFKLNASYPDGTPRKLLDSSKILEMGWAPKITLRRGIEETIKWAQENSV